MLPNCLHVGAAKCKSSWLYEVCLAHPGIYVPGHGYDNVNFFVNAYHRGMAWYEETFFGECAGEPVVCEFSNSYMASEIALQRIAKHLPGVKLTMIIMNPVHRLFYAWAHSHLKKKCVMEVFGEKRKLSRVEVQEWLERCGMDPERGMLVPPTYYLHHYGHNLFRQVADASFYAFCIRRIGRYFAPEQVKVMLYDDLLADKDAFLREYFTFLGVTPEIECDLKPEDVNPDPPIAGYERWFPPELQEELTEAFREDIEDLQGLLGRDLSHWLDPTAEPPYTQDWR